MQEEVVKTHTRTYYHTFPSHHAFTSAPDGLTHTPFGAFKGLCFFSADDIQKYWMFFGSNLFPCAPPPPKGATWVIKSLGVWRGACRRRGRLPRLHLIISHTFSCICDSDKLQGTGEGKDEGEREKGKR